MLTSEARQIDLAPHLSFMRDPMGKIGVDEALASQSWDPLPGAFNIGFTRDAIWLRLDIDRPVKVAPVWLLEVNNSVFDELRLYERLPDATWREQLAGDDIPRANWEHPGRTPVFRLDLSESGRRTLLLRITARNSISAQITLWHPQRFSAASRDESFAYGLLFGIYAFIILIHFFFWRWARESLSGWYALYVANSFGQMLISFGYVQLYSGLNGQISDMMLALLICSSPWIGAKLLTNQLELGDVLPALQKWIVQISGAIAIVTCTLSLGVSYTAGVMPTQIFSLAIALTLIILAINLAWRGHRPGVFFLIAYGPLVVGILVRVMRNFTLLPPNFITDNGYQIGAIAHMIVMSLVLMNRYNLMKEKMAQAQADALNIKTMHAEALESEVKLRTASLTSEINRREALEKELRQSLEVEKTARQEQRDFVAMVSHEFRTPLAVIDTSVQRIAGGTQPEQTIDRCRNVRDSVRRMTRLMDEFLSLDRVDSDLRTSTIKATDPKKILDGAMAEWDRGSVELSTEVLPSSIRCDEQLLRIALRNLLSNALRHSPEGVPVKLKARKGLEDGIEFEVSDSGSGIPADEIPKLFQKYFRGRGAQNEPGAGLGLYLTERIAKLHGGSVTVSSNSEGSRFVLTIPSKPSGKP